MLALYRLEFYAVINIYSLHFIIFPSLLQIIQPGATTRKGSHYVDRQNSEILYYADDEDGDHKKYSRRGNIFFMKIKFLKFVNNESTFLYVGFLVAFFNVILLI